MIDAEREPIDATEAVEDGATTQDEKEFGAELRFLTLSIDR